MKVKYLGAEWVELISLNVAKDMLDLMLVVFLGHTEKDFFAKYCTSLRCVARMEWHAVDSHTNSYLYT